MRLNSRTFRNFSRFIVFWCRPTYGKINFRPMEGSLPTERTVKTLSVLSLRWAHSHFVGFVMRWLNCRSILKIIFSSIKNRIQYILGVNKTCIPLLTYGPRQANLVLIAYASSEGSGEPAHPRSLARTFAARLYKQWVKRNLQTESQIPGPSEWLGMRS